MRLFLAILMTVAQLAGPWLCCCGPIRAIAAVRTPEPMPAPVDAGGGCPHCKKEAPPQPKEPPQKAPHAPDRCPCGGMQVVAVPPANPDPTPTADALLVPLSAEPTLVLAVVSVPVGSVDGLRELPHLTTSDRLFAHHVLRC